MHARRIIYGRKPLINSLLESRQKHARSEPEGELNQDVKESFAQTWILYHLAGALAQRTLETSRKRRIATEQLERLAMDIHHFVLVVCGSCYTHHALMLREFPISECADFEKYVFDMHNRVNERVGVKALAPEDFDAVREHYRTSLESMGRGVTATVLSRSLPILAPRFCYSC